jgi:butyrate kinase
MTIKHYNRQLNELTLGFPNEEVKYGFLNALLPSYVPQASVDHDFSVTSFIKKLYSGDMDAFMTRLKAFFAYLSKCQSSENDRHFAENNKTERHYQTVFYLLFTLMGQYTQAEVRSSRGRADAVVITGGSGRRGCRKRSMCLSLNLRMPVILRKMRSNN